MDGSWQIQSNHSLCEIRDNFVYWPGSALPPDELKAQGNIVEFNLGSIIYKGTIWLTPKGQLQIVWDDGDIWIKYDTPEIKHSVNQTFTKT